MRILRVYYVFQGAGNSVQCSDVESVLFFKGRKMEVYSAVSRHAIIMNCLQIVCN